MTIAQQMLNASATAATTTIPELLTPADAAKLLNVAEADVIASLESGDLKGKRVGSQWRLTRAQLQQFLQ
jgi:excisionase family DNA binding protein